MFLSVVILIKCAVKEIKYINWFEDFSFYYNVKNSFKNHLSTFQITEITIDGGFSFNKITSPTSVRMEDKAKYQILIKFAILKQKITQSGERLKEGK